MSFDVGEATEGLEKSCDVCEATEVWRLSCEEGEVMEGVEIELLRR